MADYAPLILDLTAQPKRRQLAAGEAVLANSIKPVSGTALELGGAGVTTTAAGTLSVNILQVTGSETITSSATFDGTVNLGDGSDIVNIGSGTDTVNLKDHLLVIGKKTLGTAASYAGDLYIENVANSAGVSISGTSGATAVGVDTGSIAQSSAVDLQTLLGDFGTAITNAENNTLQEAYVNGNALAITAAEGALALTNSTEDAAMMTMAASFSESSVALSITDGQVSFTTADQITMTGNLDANGGIDVTGALDVSGATTLDGAVTLGDASDDDIVFSGSLASTVLIKTDSAYNLGDTTHAMLSVYADAVRTVSGTALTLASDNEITVDATKIQFTGDGTGSGREIHAGGVTGAAEPSHALGLFGGNIVNVGNSNDAGAVVLRGGTTTGSGASGGLLLGDATTSTYQLGNSAMAATTLYAEVVATGSVVELKAAGGASAIGFDQTTIGTGADDVQEAIDDLFGLITGANSFKEILEGGVAGENDALMAGKADPTISISNTGVAEGDAVDVFSLSRAPSSAANQGGNALTLTMGANATGAALNITNGGSGNALTIDAGLASLGGALTVAGIATLNGNVLLGSASGDDITFPGSLASSIPVKTDSSFNIGDATHALAAVYADSVVAATSQALTLTGNLASTWSTSAGALTLTSAEAATWSTAAGILTLDGAGGMALDANAGNLTVTAADVDLQANVTTLDIKGGGSSPGDISIDGTPLTVALTSALMDEMLTFFGNTDITGAQAETLTDGSNADSLHTHTALDSTYEIEAATGGLSAGECVAIKSQTGTPVAAKADATAASGVQQGMGVVLADAAGAATAEVVYGGERTIVDARWVTAPVAADIGKVAYVSKTAGKLTLDVSAFTAGDAVKQIGFITFADASADTTRMLVQPGSADFV